jgi:transposase-like protein
LSRQRDDSIYFLSQKYTENCDISEKNFTAKPKKEREEEKWVSDSTYLRVLGGWVYLMVGEAV